MMEVNNIVIFIEAMKLSRNMMYTRFKLTADRRSQ